MKFEMRDKELSVGLAPVYAMRSLPFEYTFDHMCCGSMTADAARAMLDRLPFVAVYVPKLEFSPVIGSILRQIDPSTAKIVVNVEMDCSESRISFHPVDCRLRGVQPRSRSNIAYFNSGYGKDGKPVLQVDISDYVRRETAGMRSLVLPMELQFY